MKWDLTDLYKSLDDHKIAKDKAKITGLASTFTKKYKNKLKTAKIVETSLKDYEKILEKLYIPLYYAGFRHSTDTKSVKVAKFYQDANEFYANTMSDLVWYELELAKANVSVKVYEYYLEKARKFKPYLLSEKEEFVLTKKQQTSTQAFKRFYDEHSSKVTVEFKTNGKKKSLNESEIGSIMKNDPNRNVRKKATKARDEAYKSQMHFYTFSLNNLLLDKKIEDELRGHKYPQEHTYINYGVDKKMVDTMVDVVQKGYRISEKFYLAKAKKLGVKNLHEWDRYSSLGKDKNKYTWSEAKDIVLEAFINFDPEFAQIANKFFDNNWIDGKITKNRQSGAYCAYLTPNLHPYIFTNFSGDLSCVMAIAHELGHGIHAYLSREQTMLNFFPSTVTAEVASVFAESIVFDHMYSKLKSNQEKIDLLAYKIQGSFATVFRQTAFHLYETDIHDHRRTKGELSSDDFSNYFQKRLQAMFGKGLTLTGGHKYSWMPISHFYHYNFYVFAYSFGELLALSLYDLYKSDQSNFNESYLSLLKSGGSLSPKDLLKGMDQDISKKGFWVKGMNLLENYLSEFEKLI